MVILTILHISHHPVVTSSPVGFSHAKVQRSSGIKHHCANGSRICPAAFRKSKMAFQPPPRTSAGWVFREIPRPFACLSVLSPLCWLACKISPAKEAERLRKQGEEKKQVYNNSSPPSISPLCLMSGVYGRDTPIKQKFKKGETKERHCPTRILIGRPESVSTTGSPRQYP